MPSTADVGDPGTVFAPNFAVHKRPRLDAIHGSEKRLAHPSKKICLGGGRVSGLTRQSLISGLLPRVEIVESAVSVVEGDTPASKERNLPPSFTSSGNTAQAPPSSVVRQPSRWQETLPVEQEVRRYSEYHAELEAAAARWAASLPETPEELVPLTPGQEVVAPTPGVLPAAGQDLVAPTPGVQPDAAQEVVAPTPGAQPAAGQEVVAHAYVAQEVSPPAVQAIQASSYTQTVSSMHQSFAYDDTRSGYDDDSDYPL